KLSFHLLDLVLCFNQVLAVQVAVRAHGLVQVLLLLKFGLALHNALLQIDDCHLAQLHLLQGLHVLGGCLAGLNAILFALLLQLVNQLGLLLGLRLISLDLLLQVALGVLVDLDKINLLLGRVLGLPGQGIAEQADSTMI
ncbi:hypothetical protein Vafri_17431, partial [Volvox africanus]